MIKKLMQFREKTMEVYRQEQEKKMEPWKKRVMSLHEKSGFLFYYEASEPASADSRHWMLQGEVALGTAPEDARLFLYDGEGNILGEGRMESSPEEKEEKRRGFLRPRKNEFAITMTVLGGEETEKMDKKALNRSLNHLFLNLSLLSDIKM